MSQIAASYRSEAHSLDDREKHPGDLSNKYPPGLRADPGTRHASAPVMRSRSSGAFQSEVSSGDTRNTALYIGEMHWVGECLGQRCEKHRTRALSTRNDRQWTSDQHIRDLCLRVGIDVPLRNISFSEHKVNGKSKGLAFVDFESNELARKVQSWLETHGFQSKKVTAKLGVGGTGVTPFRTLPKGAGNALHRDENSASQTGGQSRAGDSAGTRSVSDSMMWRQSKEKVEPSKTNRGPNTKPAVSNNNWRSRA
ncbi:BQ2448_513 [Microbotryum intermedium]|uniref:BQ2448_513 protein n=1 Tax=Microbotryum intermedium TaxID=269621 RepID=A0A238F2M9_9BASI|nr:BQ2448_513 [Microbotryum intermedium]